MRIIKIIFFFLFITPGQSDIPTRVSDDDNSNDHGQLNQSISAMVNENLPLNHLKSGSKTKKSKFFQTYSGSGVPFGHLVLNNTTPVFGDHNLNTTIYTQTLINDNLLRHCLRSKSCSRDNEDSASHWA